MIKTCYKKDMMETYSEVHIFVETPLKKIHFSEFAIFITHAVMWFLHKFIKLRTLVYIHVWKATGLETVKSYAKLYLKCKLVSCFTSTVRLSVCNFLSEHFESVDHYCSVEKVNQIIRALSLDPPPPRLNDNQCKNRYHTQEVFDFWPVMPRQPRRWLNTSSKS